MRSGRMRRTLKRHTKKSIKKSRKNNKELGSKVRRSLRNSKNRRKKKGKKRGTKKKKSRRRKHKFQKFLDQEYVNKFRSPHRTSADCAVCSMNFLNVLPQEILQDMIDEIGCAGITHGEILKYFEEAYGSEHDFKFIHSRLFIDSQNNYNLEYINYYLNILKNVIKPGYGCLLGIKRPRGRIGHFVVIGKGIDDILILFETTFNPDTGNLGVYGGNEKIIQYFMDQDVISTIILSSNLVDGETKLNIAVPMETSDLIYRCKILTDDPGQRAYYDSRMEFT
jgi:hypothetical protein